MFAETSGLLSATTRELFDPSVELSRLADCRLLCLPIGDVFELVPPEIEACVVPLRDAARSCLFEAALFEAGVLEAGVFEAGVSGPGVCVACPWACELFVGSVVLASFGDEASIASELFEVIPVLLAERFCAILIDEEGAAELTAPGTGVATPGAELPDEAAIEDEVDTVLRTVEGECVSSPFQRRPAPSINPVRLRPVAIACSVTKLRTAW
jgi:hypothetical protein